MINKNIKCPSCHTSFNIGENAYAEIRAQIKDIEIESSVTKRVDELLVQGLVEVGLSLPPQLQVERIVQTGLK